MVTKKIGVEMAAARAENTPQTKIATSTKHNTPRFKLPPATVARWTRQVFAASKATRVSAGLVPLPRGGASRIAHRHTDVTAALGCQSFPQTQKCRCRHESPGEKRLTLPEPGRAGQ